MSVTIILQKLSGLKSEEIRPVLLHLANESNYHDEIIYFVANELQDTEMLDLLIVKGLKININKVKVESISMYLKEKYNMCGLKVRLINFADEYNAKKNYSSLEILLNNLDSPNELDELIVYLPELLKKGADLLYYALTKNNHLLLKKLIDQYHFNINTEFLGDTRFTVLERACKETILSPEMINIILFHDIKFTNWPNDCCKRFVDSISSAYIEILSKQSKMSESESKLKETEKLLDEAKTNLDQYKSELAKTKNQLAELKDKLGGIINYTA